MTVLTSHWHHDILRLSAQEIRERYDDATLPNVRILMPNRRSCIAMREAFRDVNDTSTVILPQILPLADAESELWLAQASSQLPQAMSPWQHRMLLAELVMQFETARSTQRPSLRHVLALTDDLIDMQQNLIREGVDVSEVDVANLALPDAPEHWQVQAQFLDVLFRQWPAIERAMGLTTRANREQALLRGIAKAWANESPTHPIWLIGSTGSMPAVREVMAAVNDMPQGFVVLPGLDTQLKQPVAIGHGQYYLQQSLQAMGVEANDVKLLGDATITARQHLWLGHETAHADGIETICARHEDEEAGIISLIVREALEGTGDVAVITPSPTVMQRVRQHLQRFDIIVNTPQGTPLAQQPAGQAWIFLLRCLNEGVSTLPLLELFHAPNVTCGEEPAAWQSFMRAWRKRCRGVLGTTKPSDRVRALSGDYAIAQTVSRIIHDMEGLHRQRFTLSEWLAHLSAIVKRLTPESLQGHEAVQDLIAELMQASSEMALSIEDAHDVLQEALMKPLRVPDMAAHPRVFVLSPMEARLQCFKRVILAGFNEGDWPIGYKPSPWLNLGQRSKLGMTPPEAHATLTAHDVQTLGMAPEVFITRSAKSAGSPTQPSRYLVRLETQLERAGITPNTRPWNAWWNELNDTDYVMSEAVAPNPPVTARPDVLKVTSLRNLFSDPYAIYAEYVLGLKELEPFDKTPDAATFGSLIHKLIEEMLRGEKTADDADWLLARVAHLEGDARLYSLWLPRIRNILRFVSAMHAERKCDSVEMETPIERNIGPVTLKGKIDRLEKQGEAYGIHDYKTGGAPKPKEMETGLEPQLIAYALMLSQETGIPPAQLTYWELPKARHSGELVDYQFGKNATLATHIEALQIAINHMFEADYRFLALDDNGVYAGVSRNDEWAA